MTVLNLRAGLDVDEAGRAMHQFISELYPICRSITGNGVRETLRMIQERIPLMIREVPTGTVVFDWAVPKEWNIKDAYVKGPDGRRRVDFQRSNLHVVSYSTPLKRKMSLTELKEHVFTLPDHPDWIPYRTSYYRENWGFCMSHNQFLQLQDDEYEVCIDSRLDDGSLTYGEFLLEGSGPDEVLISVHTCHPSLCNDNLSGVAVATSLARVLLGKALRHSYRFLFIPGTIGSLTWLSLNENSLAKIRHGLVATCLGDPGGFAYKKSRRGNAEIDQAVANVLRDWGGAHEVVDFSPYGYDERQYCSPGFDLPVGALSRTPHGRFPEYHTSADNLDLVRPRCLGESLLILLAVAEVLENNGRYVSQNQRGEPQLGKRGLYRAIGGESSARVLEMAMLWTLNFSDGRHTLLDISDRSALEFSLIGNAAQVLLDHGLLKQSPE